MADAELLIEEVSSYLKPQDVEHVREAIEFSRVAHHGQTRQSGDPYVTHPIAVARILAPLHLDTQSIIAALLHDVIEDTEITAEQIAEKFGHPVATLVEGLSKLEKIQFETREDAQAENFRKMLLAMARDVRVILIKLADRLHNMRTLESMRHDKCERIARETMEIYAPIANRLGLNDIYLELQELGFKYMHPNRYGVLSKALRVARGNRREVLGKILDTIRQRLAEQHVNADVSGREKNIYSIYKKMQSKSLAFSEVLD
ncbi:MAG: HD domain-containing protein, partial [Gallionella sp.]|nr:HD domain-containing protein [Gallionella sp.]